MSSFTISHATTGSPLLMYNRVIITPVYPLTNPLEYPLDLEDAAMPRRKNKYSRISSSSLNLVPSILFFPHSSNLFGGFLSFTASLFLTLLLFYLSSQIDHVDRASNFDTLTPRRSSFIYSSITCTILTQTFKPKRCFSVELPAQLL